MCKETATDIRRLLNKTSSSIKALRNLKRPVEHWDDLIVFLVTEKFDPETRRLWENKNCSGATFPKWSDVEAFMENRAQALNAIGSKKSQPHPSSAHNRVRTHFTSSHGYESSSSSQQVCCPACSEDHEIYLCHLFVG